MTLKEKYQKEIIPAMMKEFGYKNAMAVPKLEKVIINSGLSKALKDPKFFEVIENTLMRITGQRPVKTKAKKSISSFKVRQGMVVGMKVTLRGKRMYDFVDKLINVTLPRIRDFRGLSPKNVDGGGNLNIGFREHIAFPEIKPDEVEKIHGLEVGLVTTASSHEEGLKFLKFLGFPFRE
jgi:large subunit ribosomal protein L5